MPEIRYYCLIQKDSDVNAKTEPEARKNFLSKIKEKDIVCIKVKVYK